MCLFLMNKNDMESWKKRKCNHALKHSCLQRGNDAHIVQTEKKRKGKDISINLPIDFKWEVKDYTSENTNCETEKQYL